MGLDLPPTAVIIGASSGIGAALARKLVAEGWRVGIGARRLDRLESLSAELGGETRIRCMDLADPEAAASTMTELVEELEDVALIVIAASTGHPNAAVEWPPEQDTLTVNVLGFAAVAQAAMRYFIGRRKGHLVGISSVAALRGNGAAAAYSGSKAFQSIYLDGLRDLARKNELPITVTEIQPGFVDTAMMKTDKPLHPMIKRLLVATPEAAAVQIFKAIQNRAKHVYVTRRYGIIAFFLKRMPRPG